MQSFKPRSRPMSLRHTNHIIIANTCTHTYFQGPVYTRTEHFVYFVTDYMKVITCEQIKNIYTTVGSGNKYPSHAGDGGRVIIQINNFNICTMLTTEQMNSI